MSFAGICVGWFYIGVLIWSSSKSLCFLGEFAVGNSLCAKVHCWNTVIVVVRIQPEGWLSLLISQWDPQEVHAKNGARQFDRKCMASPWSWWDGSHVLGSGQGCKQEDSVGNHCNSGTEIRNNNHLKTQSGFILFYFVVLFVCNLPLFHYTCLSSLGFLISSVWIAVTIQRSSEYSTCMLTYPTYYSKWWSQSILENCAVYWKAIGSSETIELSSPEEKTVP